MKPIRRHFRNNSSSQNVTSICSKDSKSSCPLERNLFMQLFWSRSQPTGFKCPKCFSNLGWDTFSVRYHTQNSCQPSDLLLIGGPKTHNFYLYNAEKGNKSNRIGSETGVQKQTSNKGPTYSVPTTVINTCCRP